MGWEVSPEPGAVRWRVHFRSGPEAVYRFLSTDAGRASFWAEEAREENSEIHWTFPSGLTGAMKVLDKVPFSRFACEYIDESIVEFELEEDGRGGTDLTMTNRNIPEERLLEAAAGWVSTLMNLKAVVDEGVDLRNHSDDLNWERGFVDN